MAIAANSKGIWFIRSDPFLHNLSIRAQWQSPAELPVDVNLVANMTSLVFTFQIAGG
jgi:hypothetical protein